MSIVKNTSATVAGAVIPLVISLGTIPYYLQWIGEDRYGLLAIIWVLLGYFGFFDFGLGRATARQLTKIDSDIGRSRLFCTVLVLTLALGALGGVVLMFSSQWLLSHFFTLKPEQLAETLNSLIWLPAALVLALLNATLKGALQAREEFVAINASNVLGDSLAQILPLCVAGLGWVGLDMLLPATLAARLLTCILMFVQCIKKIPLRSWGLVSAREILALLHYGGWASLLTMSGPLMTLIERLALGALVGVQGVATFTITHGLVSKLTILPFSYGAVLFPQLAALPPAQSKALAHEAGRNSLRLMTPVIVMGIALYQPFLFWWLGAEFTQRSVGLGEWLLLGIWIGAVILPYSYQLIADATLKKEILWLSTAQLPLYAVLLWLGLNQFGPMGAAMAWTLRAGIDAVLMLKLFQSMHIVKLAIVPLLGVSVVMVASMWVSPWGLDRAILIGSTAIFLSLKNWRECVGMASSWRRWLR